MRITSDCLPWPVILPEGDYPPGVEFVTRWFITSAESDTANTQAIAFTAQGRFSYATKQEALATRDAMLPSYRECFDNWRTLSVRPFPCWPGHHDPVGIYYDDIRGAEIMQKTTTAPYRAAIWQSTDKQAEIVLTLPEHATLSDEALLAEGVAEYERNGDPTADGSIYIGEWRG